MHQRQRWMHPMPPERAAWHEGAVVAACLGRRVSNCSGDRSPLPCTWGYCSPVGARVLTQPARSAGHGPAARPCGLPRLSPATFQPTALPSRSPAYQPPCCRAHGHLLRVGQGAGACLATRAGHPPAPCLPPGRGGPLPPGLPGPPTGKSGQPALRHLPLHPANSMLQRRSPAFRSPAIA
jgi:hypothetical protein